jgi:predicted transcriptional regulator
MMWNATPVKPASTFARGLRWRPEYVRVASGNTWVHLMTNRSTTSLKLDAEIKSRLRELAQARRRSSHWLIREAIEQYVEREERRERVRQDALTAWAEYQATGLHVTAEEADAWLAQLEAGEDGEPPATHR